MPTKKSPTVRSTVGEFFCIGPAGALPIRPFALPLCPVSSLSPALPVKSSQLLRKIPLVSLKRSLILAKSPHLALPLPHHLQQTRSTLTITPRSQPPPPFTNSTKEHKISSLAPTIYPSSAFFFGITCYPIQQNDQRLHLLHVKIAHNSKQIHIFV